MQGIGDREATFRLKNIQNWFILTNYSSCYCIPCHPLVSFYHSVPQVLHTHFFNVCFFIMGEYVLQVTAKQILKKI
jgi:hypothetical protein